MSFGQDGGSGQPELNSTSGITGVVEYCDRSSGAKKWYADAYGNWSFIGGGWDWDYERFTVHGNASFAASLVTKKDFILEVEKDSGTLVIEQGATMRLKGDLINLGLAEVEGELITDPDPGVVRNYGYLKVFPNGKITNLNEIYNYDGATIENLGTIDNREGKIYSNTAIDNVEGNSVQPLPSGGSGGCSASGYPFALLVLIGASLLLRARRDRRNQPPICPADRER
jgi:hypothetical protein